MWKLQQKLISASIQSLLNLKGIKLRVHSKKILHCRYDVENMSLACDRCDLSSLNWFFGLTAFMKGVV